MSYAIKIEGLGKRYLLTHQDKARYHSLRDSLSNGTNRLAVRARSLFGGQPLPARSDKEVFWALKDINFEVAQGERLAIVGRNGAGKSTLLKLLSRVTEPTQGRAILRGRIASLLEVGTGFHPELTGRENIYLNGAILGMGRPEIDRKFDEIVAFADVEKFLDTPVKRYSSGMYTRLAFSVAAHLETDILIIDEVLAVGDAAFQRKCLGKMEDVSQQGRTLLFVSHNMAAVETLCNRAVLLSGGKIVDVGDTRRIVEAYAQTWRQGVSLNERQDRSGTGHVRIESIYLEDDKRNPLTRVESMKGFTFVVTLSAATTAIGKKIDIILMVCDSSDKRLVPLYSEWAKNDLFLSNETQVFRCTLQNGLPLVATTYWLTVGILVNGVKADKLDRAIEFEIGPSESFGNEIIINTSLGSVLVEHSWM